MRYAGRVISAFIVLAVILETTLLARGGITPVMVTNFTVLGASDITIEGKYAYLTTSSGLRVFDLSDPIRPRDAGFKDSGGGCTALTSSAGYLWTIYGDGLHILDIANPTNPVVAALISGGWSHVNVAGSRAYLVAADGSGASIYDVANVIAPTSIGHLNTWISPVAGLGNYAFVAFNSVGLIVYDVSDAANPKQVAQAATSSIGGGGICVRYHPLGQLRLYLCIHQLWPGGVRHFHPDQSSAEILHQRQIWNGGDDNTNLWQLRLRADRFHMVHCLRHL